MVFILSKISKTMMWTVPYVEYFGQRDLGIMSFKNWRQTRWGQYHL